jgi:signal transduction histidine kinase
LPGLKLRKTNIMRIIEESLNRISCPANVHISVESSLQDESLWVDSEHMIDILSELEKNSLEAMPDGGLLIIQVKEDEGKVCIALTDTGRGIAEKDRNHLLEPFFTTKPPGEGIGLGLPSAYAFVKSYRGDFSIESNADPQKRKTGTTIRISLPRKMILPDKQAKIIMHDEEEKSAN